MRLSTGELSPAKSRRNRVQALAALLSLVAVYTGQRLGDVARLTWHQLDFARSEISYVTEKTGKRLCLHMEKPLQEYLESLPSADDPKTFVFPAAAGAVEKRTGTLSTKFYDEILAPAGLGPVRPHKGHKMPSAP